MNFQHLRYFQAVARYGGVTAAAEALGVSQPAVSAQLRKLEEALGHDLFDRSGRSMVLTRDGRVVLDYANEIFRLGDDLEDTVRGRLFGRPMRLVVGVAATIPNLVSFHLLEAVFEMDDPVRMVVRENRTDRLLASLAAHEVDLVLADRAVPANVGVRAYEHPLGSSPVDILAPPLMAHRLRDGFPMSLDGQPFLLPTEGYVLRRSLEEWFGRVGIRPHVFAEIENNDLANVFAETGAGMLAAPAIITDDIRVRYALEVVGRAEGVREHFFAITPKRRIEHPAIAAITESARRELRYDDA